MLLSAGMVFAAGKPVLGLVLWNKYHPVVQIMEVGFLSKAEELGYEGKLYASDGPDLAGAIALGEQAVAEKVAGLAIYQLSPGIRPLMKKASDAGIPVVVPHSKITPSEVPGPIGWVTNQNSKFEKVFGIVAQPLFKIFEESAVILDAHIKGKPYQYENMLPSPVVLQGIVKYDAILN